MRKTGMYGLDLVKYVKSLEYKFSSMRECVDIIQRDHIDVSEFPLPERYKTFEEYADDIRQQDEESKQFAVNLKRSVKNSQKLQLRGMN